MSRWLAALILCGIATTAVAQSQRFDVRPLAQQLSTAELDAALSGRTLAGAYNFSREGEARSFYSEVHTDDGRTEYTEGPLTATGQWFADDDVVCYAYDHSLLQGGCFRVYQVANCYYFYSTSVPQMPDELDRDYWVARATQDGEEPRCEGLIS